MAKEWARAFYDSAVWRRQREMYRRHVHGICELCGEPGEIVHHRRELTPQTIGDPKETLAFENLQLLCRDCHAGPHRNKLGRKRRSDTRKGLRFDPHGELMPDESPPGGSLRREEGTEKRCQRKD